MTDILTRLLGHDTWTTRQLLEHSRGLTDDQFVKRFDIGPGSVHFTFVHLIEVMLNWADRIADRERRPMSMPSEDEGIRSIDELLELLNDAEIALRDTATTIANDNRLDEMMSLTHEGQTWKFTRGSALAHVLTHGMHHRAQLFYMLKKLGLPASNDGDVIEWEIALRE